MEKRRKIILDCDPGHDDAIAILLAGQIRYFDLLAITTCAGNQTIEKTSRNAFNVARYLGFGCPIAKGATLPLVQELTTCPSVHGESGLDGFDFPNYKYDFSPLNGAELIIKTLLDNEDVTVVTTGPMTNLALALRLEPKIKENIREVIFMGGTTDYGNVSPAAEFNILVDPEACYIVLHSGLKVKMVGLNVTRKALVNKEIIAKVRAIGNTASRMVGDLLDVFLENQIKTFGIKEAPLHDPVTIASMIDESCVTFKPYKVDVDISHGPSYGRTNVDMFDYLKQKKNCFVAIDIDNEKFWNVVLDGIKEFN